MTLPDWHGESGTVIFDFLPVNWSGKDTLESIVFVQSVDGSNGNFNLYKYPAVPGLWLLTQAKLSDGKFKNSFPVMDRKSLQSCESGQWQQIALTWKRGDFVKIYLNGQLVGTASGTAFFSRGLYHNLHRPQYRRNRKTPDTRQKPDFRATPHERQ